jgi:hypothetical protein
MSSPLDPKTRAALRFTARQIFHELAMHHHNYLMAEAFTYQELPGQSQKNKAYYLRLVVSHNYAMLVITLCKVMEFHKAFRTILPPELKSELDAINSRIARSKILDYRNKFVGHLFDSKTREPLAQDAILKYWETLVGEQTQEEFRRWWWSTIREPELSSVAGLMIRIADLPL